jgi:hypothetical protein
MALDLEGSSTAELVAARDRIDAEIARRTATLSTRRRSLPAPSPSSRGKKASPPKPPQAPETLQDIAADNYAMTLLSEAPASIRKPRRPSLERVSVTRKPIGGTRYRSPRTKKASPGRSSPERSSTARTLIFGKTPALSTELATLTAAPPRRVSPRRASSPRPSPPPPPTTKSEAVRTAETVQVLRIPDGLGEGRLREALARDGVVLALQIAKNESDEVLDRAKVRFSSVVAARKVIAKGFSSPLLKRAKARPTDEPLSTAEELDADLEDYTEGSDE